MSSKEYSQWLSMKEAFDLEIEAHEELLQRMVDDRNRRSLRAKTPH